MIEMVRRFLRQKFGSVGMLIALSVLSLVTALQVAATGSPSALESGFLALILLAAGSVSRDASSGALQMILARPIRRVAYLYGRYLGILSAYAIYVIATAVLALALGELARRLLPGAPPPSPPMGDLALGIAESLLGAAFFAAILLFFSTFLRGYADVLAYILLTLLLALPDALAGPLRKPWLSKLGALARDNLLPRVPWMEVLRGERVFQAATGEYVLALVVYLVLAAVIFSRREFSYGQE